MRVGARVGPVWVSARSGRRRRGRARPGPVGWIVIGLLIFAWIGGLSNGVLKWTLWILVPLLALAAIVYRARAQSPASQRPGSPRSRP